MGWSVRDLNRRIPMAEDFHDRLTALLPLALETLASVMEGSGPDSSRLAAARDVLDRCGGKGRSLGGGPVEVTIRDPDEGR